MALRPAELRRLSRLCRAAARICSAPRCARTSASPGPRRPPGRSRPRPRAAHVLDFAEGLPQGLDTLVGEGGWGLSGGQAQRVALARAFLRDTPLVLLDEPTAHLDPGTEAQVIESLQRLCIGRTAIIASHSGARAQARPGAGDRGRARRRRAARGPGLKAMLRRPDPHPRPLAGAGRLAGRRHRRLGRLDLARRGAAGAGRAGDRRRAGRRGARRRPRLPAAAAAWWRCARRRAGRSAW